MHKRKIYFISIFLILATSIYAQDIKKIEPVKDLPPKLLPKGAESFGILTEEYGFPIAWGCKYSNGTLKKMYELGDEFSLPMIDYFTLEYIDDRIVLDYLIANHPVSGKFFYSYDGKKVVLKETTGGKDDNIEVLDSAERALTAGDIERAVGWYQSVQYPSNYMDEDQVGISILARAHQMGLSAFKKQKFALACSYIQQALNFYTNQFLMSFESKNFYDESMEGYTWKESRDSIELWLADYGYFLYKADSLETSLKVNSYINMICPQLSGPFLQLGDTQYDLKKFPEAKTAYQQYINLMKAKGKEKSVPERVLERVK